MVSKLREAGRQGNLSRKERCIERAPERTAILMGRLRGLFRPGTRFTGLR
jgi:hypothetical protein